jgi:hypothetical protein
MIVNWINRFIFIGSKICFSYIDVPLTAARKPLLVTWIQTAPGWEWLQATPSEDLGV